MQTVTSADGTTIAAESSGSGPALVLVLRAEQPALADDVVPRRRGDARGDRGWAARSQRRLKTVITERAART